MWINTCTLVAAAIASTGGEKKRKRPTFPFLLHQPSKVKTLHERIFGLFRTCTLVAAATASTAGGGGGEGGEGTEKTQFPFSVASAFQNGKTTWKVVGSFPLFPPSPTEKIIISPLADMLSWAVWFKFLLDKVIANTCLFIVTSFSKQSASWKVPEICEMCALSTDSPKTYSVNKYMYTGSNSYIFDWGGGGKKRKRPNFPFLLHQPSKMETLHEKMLGLFRYFLPAPLTNFLFPPLADMLSWAVWFKFLPNKVIANTCLFFLTSISKQSAFWQVLEIFEMCALSTDSPKTYPVNKYMFTGSNSYSFDWGGGRKRKRPNFPFLLHQPSKMETLHERMFGLFRTCTLVGAATASTAGGGGVRNGKDPISLFCCISLPKWKDYMKSCWVFSVISSQPHWEN